jgi:[ribosomal protein S5]-alanine N-acetyltransferase
MKWNIIETERLLLRELTPGTYDYVFTHFSEEELVKFFGCRSKEELAEERKKFTERLSMYRKSLLLFQLIEKASRQVIGWCGYHTWYFHHFRAELGYVLADEQRRKQGFMKEALPYVIAYGFDVMGLKRIEAMTSEENEASKKLLASMGFVFEGTLRGHYCVNGIMEDSILFSLLEHEYRKKQQQVLATAAAR